MIEETLAMEIANQYRIEHDLGIGIRHIYLAENIPFAKPRLYNYELDNTWVAYVERDLKGVLCSSLIIVVDRANGNIRYAGSAHDEG